MAENSNQGRVSVIIPCYNQAKYLPEAVDSALAQTGQPVEVIVVNDGSPDDTAKVAAAYGNRIKYVEQANQGLSGARNTGLRHSTGEYIHFLDADDYVLPGTYERMTKVLETNPTAAATYSGWRWVNEKGDYLDERHPVPEPADLFHTLLQGNIWPSHAAMLRASALQSVGEFNTALRSCEDWDLWLRLAMLGRRFVPTAGIAVSYRRYASSMSGNPRVMLEAGLGVITRNAQRHGCAICKKVLREGRDNWRGICVRDKLLPRIEPFLDKGQPLRYLWECGRVLGYDPASAWQCVKFLRFRKRKILAGVLGRRISD